MNSRPFYFEIKDTITQFIAAFDNIVISRFNKNREEEDQIAVRYLYAPKQRVMHDIINENKTITLPAVAVHVTGVSRDRERVFNKLDGFYYNDKQAGVSRHVRSPVPVNINVSMSVIARYQTDMDQILSNFIPFANPYIIISWLVPKDFGLPADQEIRSEVLWDGNVALNYPVELVASAKARITADTTFVIKGWLFKHEADPVSNILHITSNLYAEDIITEYDALPGRPPTSVIELSGAIASGLFHTGNVFISGGLSVTENINLSGDLIVRGLVDGRDIFRDGLVLDQVASDVLLLSSSLNNIAIDITNIQTDISVLSAETVSREEAELGEATIRRFWTAERVRQSTEAWWNDGEPLEGLTFDQGTF